MGRCLNNISVIRRCLSLRSEHRNTLFDVSRVMTDKAFRDLKLSRCKNPVVVQFWREIAKRRRRSIVANIVPYITSSSTSSLQTTSCVDSCAENLRVQFPRNHGQPQNSLVNLSKGVSATSTQTSLGLLSSENFDSCSFPRGCGRRRKPAELLSLHRRIPKHHHGFHRDHSLEARKYKLGLIIFHQYIKQLNEKIKDAVFGNVGTICAYRVGSEDAEFLEKQFAPVFTAYDLMNVDNFNGFLKMLVRNKAERPFSIQGMMHRKGTRSCWRK